MEEVREPDESLEVFFQLAQDSDFLDSFGGEVTEYLPALEGDTETEATSEEAPFELFDTDDGFVIRIEVPDFRPEDLVVSVGPQTIFLIAKGKEAGLPRGGRPRALFQVVELPERSNPAGTTAALENGMLEIFIPKLQDAPCLWPAA